MVNDALSVQENFRKIGPGEGKATTAGPTFPRRELVEKTPEDELLRRPLSALRG
jgi:hypothetical protein